MSTNYIEGLQETGLVQSLRWQDFIAVVTAKGLSLDYTTSTDTYTVYAQDGLTVLATSLIFANASSYPFPFPDGYTLAQNNTDLASFVATYQATANTVTHFSVGATGAAIPLSADLIGFSVSGNLTAVSSVNPLPVTGTIMTSNPSVGLTGVTAPTYATEIGGVDTTGKLQAAGITLASTAAIATQQALVTAFSPNSPLPAGINAIGSVTVTGTVAVTQSTSPWVTSDLADGSPSGGTAGTKSALAGGIYNSSAPTLTTGQQASLQLDASGNLLVNLKTALPAGSNNIGSVNQGTSPWIIAGGGTAGTPATGVVTIQGISGGTVVPVSLTSTTITGTVAVTQSTSPWVTSDLADGAVANGAAGTKSMLGGLIYLASAPTITTGNQNSLLGDIHGNLLVNLQTALPAGSNNIGSVNQGTSPWIIAGGGTAGSAATGVVTIQGIAGMTPISVVAGDSTVATYVASTKLLAVASVPTDILTIVGSGTKKVRITRIIISGQQSGGGNVFFQIIKRSALDTGGTSSTVTAVPYDSGDAAATAVVKAYTANPSALGATVGNVAGLNILIPGNTTQSNQPFIMEWGVPQNTKALVLNSATENLAINLNGVTMGGSALDLTVEWTEE